MNDIARTSPDYFGFFLPVGALLLSIWFFVH